MINNRQQNGRRRGRGGQRAQGGNPGRPESGNRIDSRARGNASQLHEKYKTLARDAQMQGDRVTTEYYLQFADHYFRVLSESRSRAEEQNQQRRQQAESYDDGFDGDEDYGDEGEPVRADHYQPRRDESVMRAEPRQDPRGDERRERRPSDERGDERRNGRAYTAERGERQERGERPERGERTERMPRETANAVNGQANGHAAAPLEGVVASEGQPGSEGEVAPRRRGRPRRVVEDASAPATFDAAVLPPSLGTAAGGEPAADGEEKPRRRRGRPPASEAAQAG